MGSTKFTSVGLVAIVGATSALFWHNYEGDAEVPREGALHLVALVESQEPRVHEDAGESIADRPVHERGGDRRIHPA